MTVEQIRTSYGSRADEYTRYLGSVEAMDVEDRQLIAEWVGTLQGPALDAGSGPGHWTAFISEHGVEAEGIDIVPEFVQGATTRFPQLRFRIGDFESLPSEDGSFGGVLSWYSIIHTEPKRVPLILSEFARVLRPGGTLLLGFFDGPQNEPFEHAVVTAWFWPVEAMRHELTRIGFEIVETYSRKGEGKRPHGAILARYPGGAPRSGAL